MMTAFHVYKIHNIRKASLCCCLWISWCKILLGSCGNFEWSMFKYGCSMKSSNNQSTMDHSIGFILHPKKLTSTEDGFVYTLHGIGLQPRFNKTKTTWNPNQSTLAGESQNFIFAILTMFAPWLLVPLLLIANQGTLNPPAVVVACGFGRKILPKRWASCLMSPMGWSWLRRKALICDSLTQQPDWIGHLIAPDLKHHLDSRCCAIFALEWVVMGDQRDTIYFSGSIPDHSKTCWVPVLSGPWCSVLQVKAPSGPIVGWDLYNDVGLSHAK